MIDSRDMTQARLFADGEMPEADRAAFERRVAAEPDLAAAVAYERQLKARVASTMGAPAPAALATKVLASIREPARVASQAAAANPAPADPWNILAWLRRPRPVNVFAVAACLLIVAAAVLYGIIGTPIDRVQPTNAAGLIVDAAQFVSSEHVRCAGDEAAMLEKIQARTPREAQALLSGHLGAPVRVCDLTSLGYNFVGGGRCGVPGADRSAHLIYKSMSPDTRPGYISVFIEPDLGQFDCCSDRFPEAEGVREGRIWADHGLIYLMVACRRSDLSDAAAIIRHDPGGCGR